LSTPRIGLALGGGSARGLAHIPILEAFDEIGIRPAVIAGCSMGALIGAAYASGIPAKELRAHTQRLLVNKIVAMRYVFGAKKSRLGDLLSLKGLSSVHIQGEKLVSLAFPEGVAKRVEDTLIPFKVIATDFERLEERVITEGPMVQAIAASIAIPGVISGPKIDGRIHVDGGVCNPVPFDHVRAGCDLVVAVDVTGRPRSTGRIHPTNRELALGSMFIMFHQIARLRRLVSPPDIYVEPPVDQFKGNQFFRSQELFDAAEPAKEWLKRALENRIRKIA
jgi:NTE family protein